MLRDLAPWVALFAAAIGFTGYLIARARRRRRPSEGTSPDRGWWCRARDGAVITVEPDLLGWVIRCTRGCRTPESWGGAPGERDHTIIFARKHVRHHNEGRAGKGGAYR